MKISPFAHLLAIETIAQERGKSHVRVVVREEHTNHFGFAHGGFIGGVADYALELASNSYDDGTIAMALATSTQYHRPAPLGALLEAHAHETHVGKTTATYHIALSIDGKLVASFTGTVFRKPANPS
ncbi:MAG: PaaI family thioesterase [Candidatus Kapabacteria bacterium]|jgi:phenylacetic acid degradation protein PaaD|nr:PaaI family thioesterase [Candidatus Kapabacteria bacterium]